MRRLLSILPAALISACGARSQLVAPDVPGLHDAGPPCEASPYAYAADSARTLYRYDPRSGTSTRLGVPSCGISGGVWTMTATRRHAYLVDDLAWSIWSVDLATMACVRTSVDPASVGLQPEFGVAAAGSGSSERLYLYGLARSDATPAVFVCAVSNGRCTSVGSLHPAPAGAFPVNLTYNENTNRLFAFAPQLHGANVFEIDSDTAAVVRSRSTGVTTDSTWATIADGSELFLWVGSDVVGYDLEAGVRTTMHSGAPFAVGASGFLDCP